MADTLMRTLAANLRRLRRAQRPRLSQHQLAAAAGIHRNTIARIELGEVDAVDTNTIEALCEALGVGLAELLLDPGETQDEAVKESLEAFYSSGLGAPVTADERHELESSGLPYGPLPPDGWYHALEMHRARKRGGRR